MNGIRYCYMHGKALKKTCNFLNIRFLVKWEKAIAQNSNSTNSIELPRCGPLILKMRDLVTDLQIWVKTKQVLSNYNLTNLIFV